MQHAKTVDYIVKWLSGYLSQNHFKGFTIGISGGIDSALASALCAKTDHPLLCVEMPIDQNGKEIDRASRHIDWLQEKFSKVNREKIDLSKTFSQMKSAFPALNPGEDPSLSLANTQARLRMSGLYYLSGLRSLVVVGTGNKVEDFGIGFYTKYGDGGVDISPLADLKKTEVFELATFLGLDKALLEAKPTDGLFDDNRSDEEQIGATYSELEWAMQQDQNNKTADDFSGRDLEVFKIYKKRHRANQHKWHPIPVCKIPQKLK